MSTRGRLGIELSDGSILSVYNHSDSYPEGLGVDLKTHYNSYEKVSNLIDGGDMSYAWTNQRWNDSGKQEYGANYYSYRGEDCPPRLDANKYDYLADGEEYAYIFTQNQQWVCYNRHQFEDNTMPTVVEIPSAPVAA
jgi:hypothetical protein